MEGRAAHILCLFPVTVVEASVGTPRRGCFPSCPTPGPAPSWFGPALLGQGPESVPAQTGRREPDLAFVHTFLGSDAQERSLSDPHEGSTEHPRPFANDALCLTPGALIPSLIQPLPTLGTRLQEWSVVKLNDAQPLVSSDADSNRDRLCRHK